MSKDEWEGLRDEVIYNDMLLHFRTKVFLVDLAGSFFL